MYLRAPLGAFRTSFVLVDPITNDGFSWHRRHRSHSSEIHATRLCTPPLCLNPIIRVQPQHLCFHIALRVRVPQTTGGCIYLSRSNSEVRGSQKSRGEFR